MNTVPKPEFLCNKFSEYFRNSIIQWEDKPTKVVEIMYHNPNADVDNTVKVACCQYTGLTEQDNNEFVLTGDQLLNWDVISWPELGYVMGGDNILLWCSRTHAQTSTKALHSQTLSTKVVPEIRTLAKVCSESAFMYYNGYSLNSTPEYYHVTRWLKYAPMGGSLTAAYDELMAGKAIAKVLSRETALVLNPYKDGATYPILVHHRGMVIGRFDANRNLSFVVDAEPAEVFP